MVRGRDPTVTNHGLPPLVPSTTICPTDGTLTMPSGIHIGQITLIPTLMVAGAYNVSTKRQKPVTPATSPSTALAKHLQSVYGSCPCNLRT